MSIALIAGTLGQLSYAQSTNSRSTVILRHELQASPRLIRRVVAELEMLGHKVVTAPVQSQPPAETETAEEEHTVIVLEPGLHSVTLQLNGKTLHWELPEIEVDTSEEILALALVERLRRPLELATAQTQRPVKKAEPPTPQRKKGGINSSSLARAHSPKRRGFSFGLGAGTAASPGGVGILPTLSAHMQAPLGGPFRFEVSALSAIQQAHLQAAEGSAQIWFGSAGATLEFRIPFAQRWALTPGMGIAGVYLKVVGSAISPFQSRIEQAYLWAPEGKIDLSYDLLAKLILHLELRGAWVIPQPKIAFADRTLATWGTPLTNGEIGISYMF